MHVYRRVRADPGTHTHTDPDTARTDIPIHTRSSTPFQSHTIEHPSPLTPAHANHEPLVRHNFFERTPCLSSLNPTVCGFDLIHEGFGTRMSGGGGVAKKAYVRQTSQLLANATTIEAGQ